MRTPALQTVLYASLALVACAPAPRYATSGEVAGLPFEGTADSEAARCFLERTCAPGLRERIERAKASLAPGAPDRAALRRIAREFSLDLAALLFAERVLADADNRRIQRAYARELAAVKAAEASAGTAPLTAVFAPGWFYKASPENGGDFRAVRERFEAAGVPTRLIEFDENGAVEANAAAIADYVRALPEGDYGLVSASKSGPEAALALRGLLAEDETRKVRAWINIVGVAHGSPLADRALAAPKRWIVGLLLRINGFDCEGLLGMATDASKARMRALRPGSRMLTLNYVGVPLSGHVTERGAGGYEALAAYGPNDGLTLLADEIVPESRTVIEPGADHFLALPDIGDRALALYRVVAEELAARDEGSR